MAEKHSEIYIFGKAKVNLRQLVIFNCEANPGGNPAQGNVALVEVARAYKDEKNEIKLEDCNVEAAFFPAGNSLHLNGLFLTENFGLSLRFKSDSDKFVSDGDLQEESLIEFRTQSGDRINVLSYSEGGPVT